MKNAALPPRRRPPLQVELLEDRVNPSLLGIAGETSFHAGDRIEITASIFANQFTTVVPLSVAVGNETGFAVGIPGVSVTHIYLLQKDDTVTAALVNDPPGNNEIGNVLTNLLPPQTPRFSPLEKSKFSALSDIWHNKAATYGDTTLKLLGQGSGAMYSATLSGNAGAPLVAVVNSAQAAVQAGYTVGLAAQAWRKSLDYAKLANDPPDLSYTTVAQPAPVPVTLSLQPNDPTLAAPLAAVQAVLSNGATEIALEEALDTAVNRSSSAQQAGDQASLTLQLQAIANFSQQLAATQAAQPALLQAAQQAVVGLGALPTLATSDVQALQQQVQQAGALPTVLQQALQLEGASTSDLTDLANQVLGLAPNTVAGDPGTALADPTLLTAIQDSATQLQQTTQTSVQLSPSTNPATSSQPVTLTATVAPVSASASASTPTGSVTFLDGTTALQTVPLDSTGTATLGPLTLATGTHNLSAVYTASGNFVSNSSIPFVEAVTASSTSAPADGGTPTSSPATPASTATPSSPVAPLSNSGGSTSSAPGTSGHTSTLKSVPGAALETDPSDSSKADLVVTPPTGKQLIRVSKPKHGAGIQVEILQGQAGHVKLRHTYGAKNISKLVVFGSHADVQVQFTGGVKLPVQFMSAAPTTATGKSAHK